MYSLKKVRLTIKCENDDVPIEFRVLSKQLKTTYEDTLKRLLLLEKQHPLEKKVKGLVLRL